MVKFPATRRPVYFVVELGRVFLHRYGAILSMVLTAGMASRSDKSPSSAADGTGEPHTMIWCMLIVHLPLPTTDSVFDSDGASAL